MSGRNRPHFPAPPRGAGVPSWLNGPRSLGGGAQRRKIGPRVRKIAPPGRNVGARRSNVGSRGRNVGARGRKIAPPGRNVGPPGSNVGPRRRNVGPRGRKFGAPRRNDDGPRGAVRILEGAAVRVRDRRPVRSDYAPSRSLSPTGSFPETRTPCRPVPDLRHKLTRQQD